MNQKKASFIAFVALTLVLIISLAYIVYHSLSEAVDAARRTRCESQLRQLHLALHNYHSAFGTFPPAFSVNAQGVRIHSWRALLLPFVDRRLADQYDYDQPWDSEHNRRLALRSPELFHCPRWDESSRGATTYLVPVGATFLFDHAGCRVTEENFEMLDDKVMIYEYGASSLNWLAPFDDRVDPVGAIFSTVSAGETITVLTPTGSIMTLGPRLSEKEVRTLLSFE